MSTGIQYGGALLSDTDIDRERLLTRGMVNQLNVPENSRHTFRGKPRKIWVPRILFKELMVNRHMRLTGCW
jgi:hypothetical protein